MASLHKTLAQRIKLASLPLLVIMVAIFVLVGCFDQNDDFIKGHWQRGNVHFPDDWYFDRRNYRH